MDINETVEWLRKMQSPAISEAELYGLEPGYGTSNMVYPEPEDYALEEAINAIKQLKEYQQLEKQGRLIKLPCKVGDTVYGLSMGKIISLTVNEISIFCMKGEKIINTKCQNNDEFRNYVEREFGKTVFLTKSEAEAKLKELRGVE